MTRRCVVAGACPSQLDLSVETTRCPAGGGARVATSRTATACTASRPIAARRCPEVRDERHATRSPLDGCRCREIHVQLGTERSVRYWRFGFFAITFELKVMSRFGIDEGAWLTAIFTLTDELCENL